MTSLVVVLFVSALWGGPMRSEIVFTSPAACEGFVLTLRRHTVSHVVERPCTPAANVSPFPAEPTPEPRRLGPPPPPPGESA